MKGKGVIESIKEVASSPNIPDGKIYSVRLSKLTVKDYSILELVPFSVDNLPES